MGVDDPTRTGTLIRLHREAAGMSQRELGETIEVAETTVWRWENGRVTPSLPALRRLADALGTTIDALIGDQP